MAQFYNARMKREIKGIEDILFNKDIELSQMMLDEFRNYGDNGRKPINKNDYRDKFYSIYNKEELINEIKVIYKRQDDINEEDTINKFKEANIDRKYTIQGNEIHMREFFNEIEQLFETLFENSWDKLMVMVYTLDGRVSELYFRER